MVKLIFNKSQNILRWGEVTYRAVSGGYGDPLPDGSYDIRIRNVVVRKSLEAGFHDPLSGNAWFIPLSPKFATTRSGFGIHPDGNKPGTKGCVGLKGESSEKFWKKWNNTLMSARPLVLEVTS